MGMISSILSNPREMLIFLLLAMPGRLLAISAHEFGHAWVANRCGDPTARLMGRMTLNPLKHIDLVGLVMMLVVGIGWAKPVPVNPMHFRNLRRDDLKVSLAGITMNLLLFILSTLLMFAVLGISLNRLPSVSLFNSFSSDQGAFLMEYKGEQSFIWEEDGDSFYVPVSDLLEEAPYYGNYVAREVFGAPAGYAYQMLGYFVVVNIMLAIFNLIPIPPLDGYHVLNDLVLKRKLFADQRGQMIGMGLMLALMFTGALSQGLMAVQNFIFGYLGRLAQMAFTALGIL